MMGGFGVIDAMKKTMDRNRSLLRKRKSLKELNEESPIVKSKKKWAFRQSSPERISELRMQLQKEDRKNSIRRTLVFLILLISLGFLSCWLMFY